MTLIEDCLPHKCARDHQDEGVLGPMGALHACVSVAGGYQLSVGSGAWD